MFVQGRMTAIWTNNEALSVSCTTFTVCCAGDGIDRSDQVLAEKLLHTQYTYRVTIQVTDRKSRDDKNALA